MKKLHLLILSFVLLFTGCFLDSSKEQAQKELLIYCGITMVKPISEIAKIIEKQENCKISITQGGSRDLYDSLRYSKQGDLYLPGSHSYITNNEKDGFFKKSVLVGYNKAALVVAKSNPKNFTNDLNQLKDKSNLVVLCNPKSGSIGKETEAILDSFGIASEAFANSVYLTTDSRKISHAIKNKEADIAMNWYATAFWEDNEPYIDAIEIDEKYAKKKKLSLTLLSFSKHPEIAQKFMDYAVSKEGKMIFHKYGFLTKKDMQEK